VPSFVSEGGGFGESRERRAQTDLDKRLKEYAKELEVKDETTKEESIDELVERIIDEIEERERLERELDERIERVLKELEEEQTAKEEDGEELYGDITDTRKDLQNRFVEDFQEQTQEESERTTDKPEDESEEEKEVEPESPATESCEQYKATPYGHLSGPPHTTDRYPVTAATTYSQISGYF